MHNLPVPYGAIKLEECVLKNISNIYFTDFALFGQFNPAVISGDQWN